MKERAVKGHAGKSALGRGNDIGRLQGEKQNEACKCTGKVWEENVKGK